MIAYKGRESKRMRGIKMPRNIERLYKEGKCRDCSVVVTRMDFAKILGKFTKVKIQYESSSTGKTQKLTDTATPQSNARLKNNENGMVLLHRNAYNEHPAKELSNSYSKKSKMSKSTSRQVSNVLKENNGFNKSKDNLTNHNIKQIEKSKDSKQYAIIFSDPLSNNNNEVKSNYSLIELLPNVGKSILPSDEWCIDCFPKNEEPTDDKVYDRIAAELEDLMYTEKADNKLCKPESTENKGDDFPSIMDILYDNTTPVNNTDLKDQSSNVEFKDNLESSDVEAMLLGSQSVNENKIKDEKILEGLPMEVDNNDVNELIEDVVQFNVINEDKAKSTDAIETENPHSPSILDEALQKGIEEHLPCIQTEKEEIDVPVLPDNNGGIEQNSTESNINITIVENSENVKQTDIKSSTEAPKNCLNISSSMKLEDVTHIIFKKVTDGICQKSVTCPKNMKYSIELEGKSVEFLGAPKNISSLEDLQVLLQIVNETDLKSLYVLY